MLNINKIIKLTNEIIRYQESEENQRYLKSVRLDVVVRREAVVHNFGIIYTFRSVMLPATYNKHRDTNLEQF